MIIVAKINLQQINDLYVFRGEKGDYLEICLMENRNGRDEYGQDFMVVQSIDQKDRKAGKRGAILGNAKFLDVKQNAESRQDRGGGMDQTRREGGYGGAQSREPQQRSCGGAQQQPARRRPPPPSRQASHPVHGDDNLNYDYPADEAADDESNMPF